MFIFQPPFLPLKKSSLFPFFLFFLFSFLLQTTLFPSVQVIIIFQWGLFFLDQLFVYSLLHILSVWIACASLNGEYELNILYCFVSLSSESLPHFLVPFKIMKCSWRNGKNVLVVGPFWLIRSRMISKSDNFRIK